MILNAMAGKLKRQSKDDLKRLHFKAWLIVQAVTWYLRYPLSHRDLEEMFGERGFEVDRSTINRWIDRLVGLPRAAGHTPPQVYDHIRDRYHRSLH